MLKFFQKPVRPTLAELQETAQFLVHLQVLSEIASTAAGLAELQTHSALVNELHQRFASLDGSRWPQAERVCPSTIQTLLPEIQAAMRK